MWDTRDMENIVPDSCLDGLEWLLSVHCWFMAPLRVRRSLTHPGLPGASIIAHGSHWVVTTWAEPGT